MAYDVEVTDTFGGEANYCWVRRYIVEGGSSTAPRNVRAIVRRAKAEAGWTGLRCDTSDIGDTIEVRPVGRSAPCWIMFITWRDVSDPYRYNPEYEDDKEEDDTAENDPAGVPDNAYNPEVRAASVPHFPPMQGGEFR